MMRRGIEVTPVRIKLAMAQAKIPDLNLYVAGQEDGTWVLEPSPGCDSFRIVVHSNRAQHTTLPELRSLTS